MEVKRHGIHGFSLKAETDFEKYILSVLAERPLNHMKYWIPEKFELVSSLVSEDITGSNICNTLFPDDYETDKQMTNSEKKEG